MDMRGILGSDAMLLQGTSRAHERQHHKRDVQNLAAKKSKCKTKYGCKQDSKSKKIYRKKTTS